MGIPVEKTLVDSSSLNLNCPDDSDQPLTIFVRHNVLRGHEQVFERWCNKINLLAQRYDGFISTEVIKPVCTDEQDEENKNCSATRDADEYISIVRFQNYTKLKKWMDSDDRKGMLNRTSEFSNRKSVYSYHSVEHWFPSSTGTASGGAKPPGPPPKWKMTIFVTLVIYSQSIWVQKFMKKKLPEVNWYWLVLLNTLIVVTLVTYIMFPICTRLAAFWLFPEAKYTDKLRELIPKFLTDKNPSTSLPDKK
jgi:uncharacterized protein